MGKHYDPNLRYKLPTNNNRSKIVLNREFKIYSRHIEENLKNRITESETYRSGRDKKLLELCVEHAMDYQKPTDCTNTVMLTHPFYMHLSHMYAINNESLHEQADKYLDTLLYLLNLDRDGSDVNFVVLDTLHNYAAATSLLMEKGLIDRVIFTYYDNGQPLDSEELIPYSDNVIYFGGGYNERCLTISIDKMQYYISDGELWGIEELVINSPLDICSEDGERLEAKKVRGLDSKNMVKLEKLIEILGLKEKK